MPISKPRFLALLAVFVISLPGAIFGGDPGAGAKPAVVDESGGPESLQLRNKKLISRVVAQLQHDPETAMAYNNSATMPEVVQQAAGILNSQAGTEPKKLMDQAKALVNSLPPDNENSHERIAFMSILGLIHTAVLDGLPPSQVAPSSGGEPGPGSQPSLSRNHLPVDPRTQPAPNSRGDPGDFFMTIHRQRDQGKVLVRPNDPGALGNLGWDYFNQGNYQEGYDYSRRAIENGSKDPNVWVAYGASAYQLGDHALANEAGRTAWELDPNNEAAERLYKLSMDKKSAVHLPSLASTLGALNQQSGDASMKEAGDAPKGSSFFGAGGTGSNMTAAEIAAAAARQSAAPRSGVEQSAALTREAADDLGVHDYQAAYNIASKAIDLNPRNAQAWNYRAIADNKLSKFSDAVYDASFSLGLAPGNAPALQSRSWAFSKQGKYREALADANFTLEKEPTNSFAFQNRAYALAGLGDKDGAVAALRRSAELDPRFKDKLDRAMQAPEASDLLFLFDAEPGARVGAAGGAATAPKGRFMRLFMLSLLGGLLVAIGLLHIVSASWREKVRSTIRRVIGSAPQAAAAAETGGFPTSGFWTQYRVLRQIGTGGMGVVYEAKDLSLNRPVAIKKMRDEIRTEPSERQRFVTEARTVAALHHPNIVDIYSIVEDEADVYLVFEYVNGKTLADLLRDKGPLDFDAALKILRGACEAVDYAHRQKVIHRDIKPSNIMLSEDGRVKVMDFGVARQAKDAITKLSLTNTIVGTPPYMAPEQEQGTVRKESDVFGLGVVFYELLSGKLPFNGHGAGMLLNKINGRHNPLTEQVKGTAPSGLDAIIAKALAPDPERRYRTPAELLAAVDALASSRA